MYVIEGESKPPSIQSVTYHLHPTFNPSTITTDEAPFFMQRIGFVFSLVFLVVVVVFVMSFSSFF
jgi:transcription initiation factor IIF auxiliary subunit